MDEKPLTITEFARMGGLARAKKLTPERRRAIALKASQKHAKNARARARKLAAALKTE